MFYGHISQTSAPHLQKIAVRASAGDPGCEINIVSEVCHAQPDHPCEATLIKYLLHKRAQMFRLCLQARDLVARLVLAVATAQPDTRTSQSDDSVKHRSFTSQEALGSEQLV